MNASVPAFRLIAFVAISIALHAFVLSAYAPGTQSRGSGSGDTAPLYATLALSPAEPVTDDFAGRDIDAEDSGATASAPRIPTQAKRAFAAPDVWFNGEELSVRAEPLTEVQIRYPSELAGTGMPGAVRLLLHIDERGFVRKANVETSLPDAAFGAAALTAWREVRFSPALKDGVSVKSRKRLEISFLP